MDIELDSVVEVVSVPPPSGHSEAVELELGPDSVVDAPPSITVAAPFAAAVDVPPARLATPQAVRAEPFVSAAPIETRAEAGEAGRPSGRRRKNILLAGAAALGIVLFVLAAKHIARRQSEATSPVVHPPATSSTAESSPPAASVAAPQEAPPALSAPAPSRETPAAPAAASLPAEPLAAPRAAAAAPPPVEAPVAPAGTPEGRPPVAVPPSLPPSPRAAPAPATKPRPKPTFDPNSL
jgi:hypothetical protein